MFRGPSRDPSEPKERSDPSSGGRFTLRYLLGDGDVAGCRLDEAGLQQTSDAARGAKAFGLPLGVNLVVRIAAREVEVKIRHESFLSVREVDEKQFSASLPDYRGHKAKALVNQDQGSSNMLKMLRGRI